MSAPEPLGVEASAEHLPVTSDAQWGSMVERILTTAEQAREAPAVGGTGSELSYGELHRLALSLAGRLQAAGVGRGDVVALCLERSADLAVATLGIWLSGAAYLPLDAGHPPDRLAFVLADSGARIVVCHASLAGRLPEGRHRLLVEDLRRPSDLVAQPVLPRPQDPAYVIYTSGSTGTPKGVSVSHGNLAAYATAAGETYGVSPSTVSLVHTPLTFDLTITSLFLPLSVGGRVEMASPEAGPEALPAWVAEVDAGQVLLKLTPAHLQIVAKDLPGRDGLTVVVGGEALLWHHVESLAGRSGVLVFNEYGPTEATVGCAVHLCTVEDAERPIPIGRPLGRSLLYVVDEQGAPATEGELLIAGPQVANGYLERPDLTKERFVRDRFARGGGMMFRTGDRARWRGDGELEFLGRLDDQVKIRGHRVEPGEVEVALRAHDSVADAVVVTVGSDVERRLVAHVVPVHGAAAPSTTELRAWLERSLPAYMIPAAFEQRQELPLTSNGKVDRGALSGPGGARPELDDAFVPPSTDVERCLAGIWADVLGVDRVGVNDNFFELGGDSMLTIKVASRARAAGLALTAAAIFENQSVAALAEAVRSEQPAEPIWLNAAEVEVASAWRDVLGRAPRDSTENFFDAGGDSLATLHLCSILAPCGSRRLSPARLVENATIPGIASLMRRSSGRPPDPCLVRLRGGEGPALVLIHPAGGMVTWYAPLCRRLRYPGPIWGLQSRGLTPGQPFHRSIDEMASDYAERIEAGLPEAPIAVGGYSMGGTIAIDVARRLRGSAHRPQLVVLLDTWARMSPGWHDPRHAVKVLVDEILQLKVDSVALADRPADEQAAAILAAAQADGRLPDDFELEHLSRMLEIYEHNNHAVAVHEARSYDGHVALLRTDGSEASSDTALGWKLLLPDLRVERAPGNHFTLLDEGNASKLGALLDEVLHGVSATGGDG